ncbi:hypothetical protein ACLOJK_037466, partial [Asimina triloba]
MGLPVAMVRKMDTAQIGRRLSDVLADNGCGGISSSPSFWSDQIYRSDARRKSHCWQPWMMMVEHHI